MPILYALIVCGGLALGCCWLTVGTGVKWW
jgi:hypothetical protein